jgi:hypothetical protein
MRVLAIDPGPVESAVVLVDGDIVLWFDKASNSDLLRKLATWRFSSHLVIEEIACYGMPVGKEVFDTVFWSGRFAQAFVESWSLLPRISVKMHLCHDSRAKDANIRQALIDRFGGKQRAIGTKKSPGPLYGISGDCWQALALAITWAETTARAA